MTDIQDRFTSVGDRTVRSLETGPEDPLGRFVLLPGLGMLGYLVPFARALADREVACSLLDVPGYGTGGPRVCEATVGAIAAVAHGWLRARVEAEGLSRWSARPTALMGHSTGAQAALRTAVAVQDEVPLDSLVLAGPTFAPHQRTLVSILTASAFAYRRESPGELVVAWDLMRNLPRVARLIRDGRGDRPEDRVGQVRARLLLAAGRADSFVPRSWLEELAGAARDPSSVTTARFPGSHNFPFPQAAALADVVTEHLLADDPQA